MDNTTNMAGAFGMPGMGLEALFTPKVALSYLRVSRLSQAQRGGGDDEGFSIPAQREANKKKAATMGAVVIKEFVDRGISAKAVNRKDLQAWPAIAKTTRTSTASCGSTVFALCPPWKASTNPRRACSSTASWLPSQSFTPATSLQRF